jgi:hypothetical protein
MVRFKNRFIIFDLTWKEEEGKVPGSSLTATDIFIALRECIVTNFGDAGWASCMASLQGQTTSVILENAMLNFQFTYAPCLHTSLSDCTGIFFHVSMNAQSKNSQSRLQGIALERVRCMRCPQSSITAPGRIWLFSERAAIR